MDFTINAGDKQGVLKGTRLDEVDQFELNGVHFVPAKLTRSNEKDELHLASQADTGRVETRSNVVAKVALKDGRVLDLPTKVEPARPEARRLVSKNIQPGDTPTGNHPRQPE